MVYEIGSRGIKLSAALILMFLAVISSERLMRGIVTRLPQKAIELYESVATLMRPFPLLVATILSVLAWACECLAFWVVIRGFKGASASVGLATAIYAGSTIAGAVSPGGLGVTEVGMASGLVALARGFDRATAFGATVLIRLATLWFAVSVGSVAVVTFQRRFRVELDAMSADR
jgi:uncharacterized protein (TIRG00374 family)